MDDDAPASIPGYHELRSLEAVDKFIEDVNAAITRLVESGQHPTFAAWLLRQSADAADDGQKLRTGLVNRVALELDERGVGRSALASALHQAGQMNSDDRAALKSRLNKARTAKKKPSAAIISPEARRALGAMIISPRQRAAAYFCQSLSALTSDTITEHKDTITERAEREEQMNCEAELRALSWGTIGALKRHGLLVSGRIRRDG